MKACSKCHTLKLLSDFQTAKKYSDGRSADCKTCRCLYQKEWYAKHRGYRVPQIEAWRKANPAKCDQYHLKTELKKYGLTIPQYEIMLSSQDGGCKICGTTKPGARFKRLVVDHDKETGRVRGLLCDLCNRGIGLLKHDLSILRSATEYLT